MLDALISVCVQCVQLCVRAVHRDVGDVPRHDLFDVFIYEGILVGVLFSVCCLSVAKINHAALCTMHAEVIKASMQLMQQPMSLYLHWHHVGQKPSAAVLTKTLTATAKAMCSCSRTEELE